MAVVSRQLLTVLTVGTCSAFLLSGCGFGAGSSTDKGPAQIRVTKDFGAKSVGTKSIPAPKESDTVMRALSRSFATDTRLGGKFVQGIEGTKASEENGRHKDWFYYVNGIEADRGAADYKLHGGDRVWWDYRDWGTAMSVPAVVGSFPEPFVHGIDGKRLPTRIECAQESRQACDTVQQKLQAVGIPASRAVVGAPVGKDTLRILVGPWPELREDETARKLEEGPSASGVFAKLSEDGALTAFDQRGRELFSCDVNCGLIAALGRKPTTWVVTEGPSSVDGSLNKIAAYLERGALKDRFAVLFSFMGPKPQLEPLPIRR